METDRGTFSLGLLLPRDHAIPIERKEDLAFQQFPNLLPQTNQTPSADRQGRQTGTTYTVFPEKKNFSQLYDSSILSGILPAIDVFMFLILRTLNNFILLIH